MDLNSSWLRKLSLISPGERGERLLGRSVLALLCLACASGLLRAQTYQIKLADYPAKGKAVKYAETTKTTTTTKLTDGGGKVLKDDKEVSVEKVNYVETSLTDLDKKGRPAKFTRKYETSSKAKDGGKAKSDAYEGETILFEANKEGKYVAKSEGKQELSKKDAAKLVKSLNERDSSTRDLMPTTAVKVGETWAIDGKKLVAVLGDESVDAKKSGGKGKLVKAYKKGDQQWGTIELTAEITMTVEKTPAKATITLKLDTAIDGSSSAGKMQAKMTFVLDQEIEEKCMKFKISVKSESVGDIERTDVK
jgi:hypothetical protein